MKFQSKEVFNSSVIAYVDSCMESILKDLLRPESIGSDAMRAILPTNFGADPFIYAMLSQSPHFYSFDKKGQAPIYTAATNGKEYFWNPYFLGGLLELQSPERENRKFNAFGVRIVMAHEALHAIYHHNKRRGQRNPSLWNICVDYKVNNTILLDLGSRNISCPSTVFRNNLGDYILISEYLAFLKDPFNAPKKLEKMSPLYKGKEQEIEKQKKIMEDYENYVHDPKNFLFYADEKFPEGIKSSEQLYDLFNAAIPQCPKCGEKGAYKMTPEQQKQMKENSESEKSENSGSESNSESGKNGEKGHSPSQSKGGGKVSKSESQESDSQENSDSHGCGNGSCDECGDPEKYWKMFDSNGQEKGLLDQHMDSDQNEQEIAKKILDAQNAAKSMGIGKTPGYYEELGGIVGKLLAPKMKWQDYLRIQKTKSKDGKTGSDWTRFKTKPLASGLITPKQKATEIQILFGYDCSGSMSAEDIAYGVSQIQNLIAKDVEAFCVPWDSIAYWESMTTISKNNAQKLAQIKVVGRGGTNVSRVFSECKEKLKSEIDFIVIATDGYLGEIEVTDLAAVKISKNTKVIWLITSDCDNFKPPFGRVFNLRNM